MVPETASGGSLTTDGALKTDSGNPVLAAGTATVGSVHVSETTATYTLGGSTATIGTVILNTASGGSLTTDGVLKTDAGTPVLAAGTATIGSILNLNTLVQTTATFVLGGSTATIGTVLLNTTTGGSLSTDGDLRVRLTQTTATTVLGPGTATVGSVILGAGTATIGAIAGFFTTTGGSLTTDGVLKTDAGTPVIAAGTATIGSVIVSETTATYVLGGGTATIGTVILNTVSGGSLTTDGVLKTDAGTPVLAAGTATIGSILNLNTLVQTTATFILGGGTATIGTVLLNTSTGGSLSTDGDLRVRLTQSTATTVLGPGTATIGRLGPNTATIGVVGLSSGVVLQAGTATIGSVNLTSPSGNSLTTDGILLTQLAPGSAAIGTVQITQTTATTVLGGSTATIGSVIISNAVDPFEDQDAFVLASGEGAVVFGFVTTDGSVATGQVGAMKMAPTRELYTIAADRTDAIHGHNISYTPKFAVIETTASNSTQVVAGVASKRIRVLNGFLISSAGANVEFRSTSNAANNLTGLIQLATTGGSGWCMPHSPVGWFQATAGGALYIYSDSAVNIGGAITYIEAS
jgi:hypothetical protein